MIPPGEITFSDGNLFVVTTLHDRPWWQRWLLGPTKTIVETYELRNGELIPTPRWRAGL